MGKKIYVVQKFESYITEYEVIADSKEDAKQKFEDGDYRLLNEYYLDGSDTWGEVEIPPEDEKKLH